MYRKWIAVRNRLRRYSYLIFIDCLIAEAGNKKHPKPNQGSEQQRGIISTMYSIQKQDSFTKSNNFKIVLLSSRKIIKYLNISNIIADLNGIV
mmetsp:Transcript_18824/g.25746  ORF Transcript_18824/g.25746 Transcript_18824/m.25746 type:complete len:93 (-) Transcript_18824:444-722(-)